MHASVSCAGLSHLSLGAIAAAALGLGALAQSPITPPLDYGDPAHWLCRPERIGFCDWDLTATIVSPDGSSAVDPHAPDPDAPADCFYVYPTASRDGASLSDVQPGEAEEIAFVRHQFARFSAVCRVFAPIYRQHTLASVFGDAGPGDPAVTLGDVTAAWNYYLANDNQGRGVVLIGHSQGAALLRELIREQVDGKPSEQLILSAMLIGTDVTVARGSDAGGDLSSMPLCREAHQLGCIITYASFRSTVPPGPDSVLGSIDSYAAYRAELLDVAKPPPGDLEIACTNPAALEGGEGELDAYLPADAYAPPFDRQPNPVAQPEWSRDSTITTPFVRVPGLLSARCAENENARYLEIIVHGDPSDGRVDDILGDIHTPSGPSAAYGLHLIDVHLAMGNLLEIVRRQTAAYAAAGR
jgi:hypothetical protein